jgi:hypothetical protein
MSLDPLRYRIGRALLCAGLEILPHGRARRTIQGCFDSLSLDMAEQEARAPAPAKPRVPPQSLEYRLWTGVLSLGLGGFIGGAGPRLLGDMPWWLLVTTAVAIPIVSDWAWRRAHS